MLPLTLYSALAEPGTPAELRLIHSSGCAYARYCVQDSAANARTQTSAKDFRTRCSGDALVSRVRDRSYLASATGFAIPASIDQTIWSTFLRSDFEVLG